MAVNILLIDDDTIGNLLVSTVINDLDCIADYQITTSGLEAIDILQSRQLIGDLPDLIFVDIKMPEIDGFEFIELCEEKFPAIKENKTIVVLSSSVREKDRKQALSYNSVIDFASKPLSEDRILEYVSFIMRQRNKAAIKK
jgi:CheY-like chemotaxis protein